MKSTPIRLLLLLLLTQGLLMSACYGGITTYVPPAEDDLDEEPLTDDDDDSEGDNVTDDDDTADLTDDDDTADDDNTTDPPEAGDCTYDGFSVEMHQGWFNTDPEYPLFVYQARNAETEPFDEIQLASYPGAPYYGPDQPGTYSLNGNNYADCSLCALLLENCDESYYCDTIYFADEGSLNISAMSNPNAPFTATLNQTVFREVTIDDDTYVSTPVPGGKTWCVDGLTVDVMTVTNN